MILESLYFFLPAYLANMAPILFKWLPGGIPINKKLFGKNKTWRGLIAAILMGGLIFWLQKLLYIKGVTQLALIDYADFSIVLGILMGSGAIIGDLTKSYYKRKHKIKEGKPWPIWDQLDFVLGGILFSLFVYVPNVKVIIVLLLFSPILHVVTNLIGYWLGIRKVKI